MNNFIHQNKLDSVSAFCLKKMDLEILRNAFKKGCNNRVSTFLKTLLWMAKCCYGNCLWRVLYIHDAAARRLQLICIWELKRIFRNIWAISLKKRPKWWSISILILHQILVPAPLSVLGLLSFTNRSVSRTVLSLVSIKTANIPEIHKALYSAGWGMPKSFILCLTCCI